MPGLTLHQENYKVEAGEPSSGRVGVGEMGPFMLEK